MVLELSASLPALYGGRPFAAACAAAAADGFTCVELWAPPQRQDWPDALQALAAHWSVTDLGEHARRRGPCLRHRRRPGGGGRSGEASSSRHARVRSPHRRCHRDQRARRRAGGRVTRGPAQTCVPAREPEVVPGPPGDSDPMLLLEPLNAVDRRSPLLGRLDDATAVLGQVGSGRAAVALRRLPPPPRGAGSAPDLRPRVALDRHVQVADLPGRAQPGTGTLAMGFVPCLTLRSRATTGGSGVSSCRRDPAAVLSSSAGPAASQVLESRSRRDRRAAEQRCARRRRRVRGADVPAVRRTHRRTGSPPARHRHLLELERAHAVQPAIARPRRARAARGRGGRRHGARLPDHLAVGGAHPPDDDVPAQPHVDRRRGDDHRQPDRRRRPAERLRQDRRRAADGRDQRGQAGRLARRGDPSTRRVVRAGADDRRLLAAHRRASRGPHSTTRRGPRSRVV